MSHLTTYRAKKALTLVRAFFFCAVDKFCRHSFEHFPFLGVQ
nr:MAG TPA: hypothetical protein [Caudoviricetes sp.]